MGFLGLFSIVILDFQRSMLIFSMTNNVKLVMQKPFDANLVTKLLKTLTSFWILKNKIVKYIRLVELAIVKVIDFIEDEHYFSTLTFMRTKLWNQLTMHLELVICMFKIIFSFCRTFLLERLFKIGKMT